MESACICLRNSSRRFTSSVSAVIPNSCAFSRSSCWSIRSRSKSFSCSLASCSAATWSDCWRASANSCSRALRMSAREMMLLLTRATISSTTVSLGVVAVVVVVWVWARSSGTTNSNVKQRAENLFMYYLIRRACTRGNLTWFPVRVVVIRLFYPFLDGSAVQNGPVPDRRLRVPLTLPAFFVPMPVASLI